MPSSIQRRDSATPVAMTIAGSDSGGGAGIQADLKTFAALGVFGTCAITALTAQNTIGVRGVSPVPVSFLLAQIDAVLEDLPVAAIKVGMIGDAPRIKALAERLEALAGTVPIVVDPVMVAKSGDRLLADDAASAMRDWLLPLAHVVTPNVPEAAVLLGWPESRIAAAPVDAARALLDAGPAAVLLKGGHLDGDEAVDWLVRQHVAAAEPIRARRVATRNTHGTGCTLAAAIAAELAKGNELSAAVASAKGYVTRAIAGADALRLGHGAGPLAWGPFAAADPD